MKLINNEIQNLDNAINQFQNNINQIIMKFNFVIDNLKIYYQIYKDIIENFDKNDNNKRKYEVYQNINEFKNNIINELNNINENNNINNQLEKIMEIYEKMVTKNISTKNKNNVDNINNHEKIIICEKCFNIPEITFLINNKIKINCVKCKTSIIKDISYFDKFILSKEDNNNNIFDLPNCSYNEEHKNKAIKYCFECEKYLCEECIKNHNMSEEDHTLIEQKIESDIFCEKENHNKKKFTKYCIKCKEYLCSSCKCEHDNQCYFLNDINKEKKINKINERILKCEEVLINEEKNLNMFLDKIYNKNEALVKMFENYKQRNLKQISLYKLLINNYEQIKNINNFNVEYNIINNDNFDFNLSNSKCSVEFGSESNECLSSRYNALYNYYLNKNHIITKQQPEYYILKKFCKQKIKKIIPIGDNWILYFFENGKSFFILLKNDENHRQIFELKYNVFIKDINLLKDKNFVMLDNENDLNIINFKDNKFTMTETNKKIELFLNDLYNKKRFFILKNEADLFFISYHYEAQKRNKYYERYEGYNDYFIYMKKKDIFSIEIFFENIYSFIEKSVIKSKHKEKFKNLFKLPKTVDDKYGLLLKIDSALLEFIDYKATKLYKKLKDFKKKKDANEVDDNKDHIIFNTNNIIYKLKSLSKIKGEYKEKINYLLNLNQFIMELRGIYFDYIAINSKINNGYNFNNNSIILLVDKYLFIEYDFKKQKFYSPITPNFAPIKGKEYKHFEIKYIYSNFIILNNNIKKYFYILAKKGDTYLIKGDFKYYSNIIGKNEYIFFDIINKSNIEFSMINLLNNLSTEKNAFNELFHFQIPFNIPKIISLNNNNKYLLLYEQNQMCIIDFNHSDKIEKKEELDNEKLNNENANKDNNNNINENSTLTPNLIKEIVIKRIGPLVPKVRKHSEIYSDSYAPSNLFDYSDNYFCSSSDSSNHFIELEFEKEYNLSYFKLICYEKETRCRLKKYSMKLFDEKLKLINELEFFGKKENSEEIKFIGEKAKFIVINFLENFTGKYFIIKNIEFYSFDEINYN